MIYMFLSNSPSSGDINSSNLSCSNCSGHMTKIATTPIYGKKNLKISSSLEPKGQLPCDFVCSIGDVGPTRFAQMMNLG